MKRLGTDYLVVHCSATKPSHDIGRAEIDQWHKDRGWAGIGYHYVIRRDGTVEPGRPLEDIGAHVEGHNARAVGICLVGGLNDAGEAAADYTGIQWEALRVVLLGLSGRWPTAEIRGHRDFPDVRKACPSFDVRVWWAGINQPSTVAA
jgi:N-acetylmuramoyl-L-alanine amidase